MMSSFFGSAVSTVSLLTQSIEGANSKLKNMTAVNNMSQSQPNVSAASNSFSSAGRNGIPSNQTKPVASGNGYIPYQSPYCTTIAPAQKIPDISITSPQELDPRPATAIGQVTTDKMDPPEVPDLSYLPEEERKLIEAVMKRQEAEETEEKDLIQ